jgi:K+-transporting ATPase KdpF subunit
VVHPDPLTEPERREGLPVSGALFANVVGGLVALGLLVYLVIALLRPERF